MNTLKNNAKLIGASAIVAVIIPALAFAGSMHSRGGFEGFGGRSNSGAMAQINTQLTASGVAVPTTDELKTERDAMQKSFEAMKNLSDADKASLKKLRDDAEAQIKTIRDTEWKAERDFLRSKGVTLPTEDQIAKIQAYHEAVAKLRGGNEEKEHGKRGFEGGRGMRGNFDGGMPQGGFGGMMNR